jgi:hypothetical protein
MSQKSVNNTEKIIIQEPEERNPDKNNSSSRSSNNLKDQKNTIACWQTYKNRLDDDHVPTRLMEKSENLTNRILRSPCILCGNKWTMDKCTICGVYLCDTWVDTVSQKTCFETFHSQEILEDRMHLQKISVKTNKQRNIMQNQSSLDVYDNSLLKEDKTEEIIPPNSFLQRKIYSRVSNSKNSESLTLNSDTTNATSWMTKFNQWKDNFSRISNTHVPTKINQTYGCKRNDVHCVLCNKVSATQCNVCRNAPLCNDWIDQKRTTCFVAFHTHKDLSLRNKEISNEKDSFSVPNTLQNDIHQSNHQSITRSDPMLSQPNLLETVSSNYRASLFSIWNDNIQRLRGLHSPYRAIIDLLPSEDQSKVRSCRPQYEEDSCILCATVTVIKCAKCKVNLCAEPDTFTKSLSCFEAFHTISDLSSRDAAKSEINADNKLLNNCTAGKKRNIATIIEDKNATEISSEEDLEHSISEEYIPER